MTEHPSSLEHLETYGFVYGHVHVPYRVERREIVAGKPRKISIRVTPDPTVIVSAPVDAEKSAIHEAVMKRAKWVYEKLQAFEAQQKHVLPRIYTSGEMLFYLGRRYLLKVEEDTGCAARIKMVRGKLLVTLPVFSADKAEQVRTLVKRWYGLRAQHVFEARLKQLLTQVSWVNEVPDYRILPMKKQWGSCSSHGTLMLNPHLVKAPRDCIDYVILHELCHIKEHNHGERFYRLLGQQMPEWKRTKRHLDGIAELLLNE